MGRWVKQCVRTGERKTVEHGGRECGLMNEYGSLPVSGDSKEGGCKRGCVAKGEHDGSWR